MFLKPKTNVENSKALLYKRFIGIEKSVSTSILYYTISNGLYWSFDNQSLVFTQIDITQAPTNSTITQVSDFSTILQYQSTYFRYNGTQWETLSSLPENITLLSASFNNIGKYQTNKYYYVGSFDYMIKGSIEGTTSQYIKGNIIPLTSLNIKYYDDNIKLSQDDLVVIEKRLYSVENPEKTQKRMPKAFNIYFATLNSIL